MEKEEILEKAQKKHPLGEMEAFKTNKACWIALIVSVVVALVFAIVEGAIGHLSSLYAITFVCYTWASVFYFCQYFVAKRSWPVLIGGVLEAVAGLGMLTLYILCNVGVI